MHEYNPILHLLYAAESVGLEIETIIAVLNKLSKTKLPKEMIDFIHAYQRKATVEREKFPTYHKLTHHTIKSTKYSQLQSTTYCC